MVEPMKTGELLAKEGFISQENIHEALVLQKRYRNLRPGKRIAFLG